MNLRVTPPSRRAAEVLARTQADDGSWKFDYSGPEFLFPLFAIAGHATGAWPAEDDREALIAGVLRTQNPDGGWGLGVESPSALYTAVGNYVGLRLLGLPPDHPSLQRARAWFLPQGGALATAAWGRYLWVLLGIQPWSAVHAVPPVWWLFPEPLGPRRLWCHTRAVYLPLSWLWGTRSQLELDPLTREIQAEVHPQPVATIRWADHRDRVAAPDARVPRHPLLRAAWSLADHLPTGLLAPQRALDAVLEAVAYEDETTRYLDIGPVNKGLHLLVWHFARPGGPEVQRHRATLGPYVKDGPLGRRVQGYESSETWDTALTLRALTCRPTEDDAPVIRRAASFLLAQQIPSDPPDRARFGRIATRGAFPFSSAAQGWSVSDCTAEAVLALLAAAPWMTEPWPAERRREAIARLLEQQLPSGGWSSYEPRRWPTWIEGLNPSDVFEDILVDFEHVECSASCLQALAAHLAHDPDWRPAEIQAALARGQAFLRRRQTPEGGWEGAWGICFAYGTCFAVRGLRAAGVAAHDEALRRAAAYLLQHQLPDGGWAEDLRACLERRWVGPDQARAVSTAWALLALAEIEAPGVPEAISRGRAALLALQRPDGSWAHQGVTGVFNRTASIHYWSYDQLFPAWALARSEG